MELTSRNSDERQAKKGKWDRPTSKPPIRSTKAGKDRTRDAVRASSHRLRGVPGKGRALC